MSKPELAEGYYHPQFSVETLAAVEEVAERQRALSTWQEFRAAQKLPEPAIFTPASGKPVEVFDMTPADGEYARTVIFNGAMGDPLNPNILMHAATVVEALNTAFPDRPSRLITISNPGPVGSRFGQLTWEQAKRTWRGDFLPAAASTLEYIQGQGIDEVTHIGYSFGAEKALAGAEHAAKYDHSVGHVALMEPASVAHQSVWGLGKNFFVSAAWLDAYAEASNSPVYMDARRHSSGLATYIPGLARVSNLAIANAIRQGRSEERTRRALDAQPEMTAHIMWGKESELVTHGLIQAVADNLRADYPGRIDVAIYPGMRHAAADDIFYHAATIIDALR